jgi:hypothetical protein
MNAACGQNIQDLFSALINISQAQRSRIFQNRKFNRRRPDNARFKEADEKLLVW